MLQMSNLTFVKLGWIQGFQVIFTDKKYYFTNFEPTEMP